METARVIFTGVAAVISLAALFTSIEALRGNYRPLLRPVPLLIQATGHVHPAELVLKNIGAGAAIAIMVFEDRRVTEATILAAADFLEPLGAMRLELDQARWLQPDRSYRIVYQDISSGWHETQLTFTKREEFNVRYLGRKQWWQWNRSIPQAALERGQIVRASESR